MLMLNVKLVSVFNYKYIARYMYVLFHLVNFAVSILYGTVIVSDYHLF